VHDGKGGGAFQYTLAIVPVLKATFHHVSSIILFQQSYKEVRLNIMTPGRKAVCKRSRQLIHAKLLTMSYRLALQMLFCDTVNH